MKTLRFTVWLGFVLVLSSFVNSGKVYACSGGSPYGFGSFLLNLDSYNTIVTGQISDVSDSGINAILDIDLVLKGDISNSRIILNRNSVEDIHAYREGRGVVRPCEVMAPRLSNGVRFVASLNRTRFGYYDGNIVSENEDGFFILEGIPEDQQNRTYEDAIAYLSEVLNETPRIPQYSRDPRPVMIRLTTDENVYILPADQMEVIEEISSNPECYGPSWVSLDLCLDHVIAPNGIDNISIYQVGAGTDAFMPNNLPFSYSLDGNAAVFSPDSALLTLWRDQELLVFSTATQFGLSDTRSGNLEQIQSLIIDSSDTLLPEAGAWSPNGRIFAFSTQSGVWLWDALTLEAQPILLLPADVDPIIVHDFSPGGNYLAVEMGDRRYYVDIHTVQEYPDGNFSPNDRLLAAFDTQTDTLTDLQIYSVLPYLRPLWNDYSLSISQFEWISDNKLILAACGEGQLPYRNETGFDESWCKVQHLVLGVSEEWIDGNLFDYDPITESLVILQNNGNQITLNGISLNPGISEPILDVEIEPLIDLSFRRF